MLSIKNYNPTKKYSPVTVSPVPRIIGSNVVLFKKAVFEKKGAEITNCVIVEVYTGPPVRDESEGCEVGRKGGCTVGNHTTLRSK